jgi:hypothetical protein
MAIRVEIFDSFEVNGNTFTGSFPVFSSNVVCSTEQQVDAAAQFGQQLEQISED